MQSTLNNDGKASPFGPLLAELTVKSAVFEHDVQRLRQAFYRDGRLDRRLAAEIFHANRIMETRDACWTEFYLEALADFFLAFEQGEIVLPADSEETFLAWLGDGMPIADMGERRLALRLLLRACKLPERLEQRVLGAILDNLLHHAERWLGPGKRSPGVIDAIDIQLIRRLLPGSSSSAARPIGRASILFMLSLDRKADRFVDPEGWRALLVSSIARHLCSASSAECSAHVDPGKDLPVALNSLIEPDEQRPGMAQLRDDILVAAGQIVSR